MFYEFCRQIARFFMRALFRLEVHGVANVPPTGGFLLVANHTSYLDVMLVGSRVRRHLHYLAKSDLFGTPVLGRLVRALNTHPIRRGGLDREGMRRCADLMRRGGIVLIFPEGTRSPDGNLQAAKPGVAMIAALAGVRCIPAYVDGGFRAWPRQRRLPRLTKIHVYYGEPFDLPPRREGMATKEHYRLCAEEMMRRIAALRPNACGSPATPRQEFK